MSQSRDWLGRRGFLVGLVTGAGVVGAVSATRRKPAAAKEPGQAQTAFGPILYRRTEEAERYYKTLYT
jgi:hypothetical protein